MPAVALTSEDNDVLFGKDFDGLFEAEPLGLHFLFHLFERHLVQRLDRHFWIFTAIFEQYEAAIWLQGFANAVQHFFRLGKFVIDIDQDDKVERVRRQLRIVNRAQHGTHIRQTPVLQFLLSWLSISGWMSSPYTSPEGPTRAARRHVK